MKRLISIIIGIILPLLLLFSSCSVSNESLDTTAISVLSLSAENSRRLEEYDSPYTIGTKNRDGTYSIYIFASPIQFKTVDGYTMIDNALIKSSDPAYSFQNAANEILTFFPYKLEDGFKVVRGNEWMTFAPIETEGFSTAKHRIYTNLYGDKMDAVVYENDDRDLVFYATGAGIKSEIVLKKKTDTPNVRFTVNTSASTYENKKNGYIRFLQGNINIAVIYQPLTKAPGQDLSTGATLELSEVSDGYELEICPDSDVLQMDKYPVKMDPSFELYRNKMPDTSVYSNNNVNSYLRHYTVVGQHPVFGEGWEYMRFRINRFMAVRASTIIEATYYRKPLSSLTDKSTISMVSIDRDWSSAQMLWTTRVFPESRITCSMTETPGLFDITDFVKDSVGDIVDIAEANGCLLRVEGGDHVIFATSDNSLYVPYIHLKLSRKPLTFVSRDNINP